MAQNQLEVRGIKEAKVDSELIFRFLMGVDKMGFFKLWGATLDDDSSERYFDLISIRASGKPLQYITGEQEFMGFAFFVNPDVLIPRPETETLVAEAVSIIKEKGKKHMSVLDLGCGSGAIGISLTKLCDNISVTATDISRAAVETATKNARQLKAERITFITGDLFEPFRGRFKTEKFDIIVSNPPYIKSGVIPTLPTEIKDHEPIIALDGGADGFDFYRKIVPEASKHLKKGGVLALEIGSDQAFAVAGIADECGSFGDIRAVEDLNGDHRVIVLEKSDE